MAHRGIVGRGSLQVSKNIQWLKIVSKHLGTFQHIPYELVVSNLLINLLGISLDMSELEPQQQHLVAQALIYEAIGPGQFVLDHRCNSSQGDLSWRHHARQEFHKMEPGCTQQNCKEPVAELESTRMLPE